MVGSTSDPLSEWHGWTAEEVCSLWNWAPGSGFLNNSEFLLTWRLAQNALPFLGLNFRPGLIALATAVGWEETVEHTFYYCERVRPFWDHSGRLASNPDSSYCSTLITSWTTFCLRFRVRNV